MTQSGVRRLTFGVTVRRCETRNMQGARRRTGPNGQNSGMARWKQWKSFQQGVALISSWAEARHFAAEGAKTGNRGSNFYTNLLYFVRSGSVPLGADAHQVVLYKALVTKLGGGLPFRVEGST